MKSITTIAICLSVFLLGVIAVLALSRPVQATGYTNPAPPTPTTQPQPATTSPEKKKNTAWQVPVLVVAIGAGAWCWYECKRPDPEPLPDPGPSVKNDVTPDLPRPDQLYLIEVR